MFVKSCKHVGRLVKYKRLKNRMESATFPIILKQKDRIIQEYYVDPLIFSEFSRKFVQEFEKNSKLIVVTKPYEKTVFSSFINACQKKKFSICEEEAYELLKIAVEWEVQSLIDYCRDYIRKNCMILPYYIIHKPKGYKEFKYPVNPTLFSLMSSKFQLESRERREFLIVEDSHTPSVFLTFIAACQQRTVTTTYDEVDELSQIADEWGAPSLKKFCLKFIEKNGLKEAPEADYLLLLIQKLEKKQDPSEDIVSVSKYLKFYLSRDDFIRIPTQVFYRILNHAEKRGVDQKLLIDCVLKKLDAYPSSAVPLVLRLNFDFMDQESYSAFFGCNKVHEQNINFFTAMSLSAINENTVRFCDSLDTRFHRDVDEISKNIDKDTDTILTKTRKARKNDFEKMRIALAQQQSAIDDLTEVLETQKVAFVDAVQKAKQYPSNDQLQRRAHEEISKSITRAGKEIHTKIDDADAKANEIKRKILIEHQQILNKALEGLGDIDPKSRDRMNKSQERLRAVMKRINVAKDQMVTAQSVMAAKVLRDKLRLDQFLRNTQYSAQLFDQNPGVWGVTSVDADNATHSVLEEIEKRIDRTCPIQETHTAF